ncbi:hypothetical protein SGPA1_21122 [Streptomyces misionensis JCM 4497]
MSGRKAPPRPGPPGDIPQGVPGSPGRAGARTPQAGTAGNEGICISHVRGNVLRVRPAQAVAPPPGGRRTVSRPGGASGRPRAGRTPAAADPGPARHATAERETRPVRPPGRPAARGDRRGAADLPGVHAGPGPAAQRPVRALRRYDGTRHGRRQVPAGPLARMGGAQQARNSRIPLVRPAPASGPGAPADRGGSGQLHPGHRADAGPGGGAPAASDGGAPPRGHPDGARRDLPGERLAAPGRPVRHAAGLRRPDLAGPRAGPAHRPGPRRPAEAAARHRARGGPPGHAPVLPRRRAAVEHAALPDRPGAGRLGARGLVPAGLRPGHAVAGARSGPGGPAADQPDRPVGGPCLPGRLPGEPDAAADPGDPPVRDGRTAFDAGPGPGGGGHRPPGCRAVRRGAAAAAQAAARRLPDGPQGGARGGRHPLTGTRVRGAPGATAHRGPSAVRVPSRGPLSGLLH